MTNNELIADALRLIGVLTEVESVSAEQAAHGLRAANNLFARWQADGVNVGWVPQSDVNADAPVDPESLEAATYNLAITLAPTYGAQVRQDVAVIASQSYFRLLRDCMVAKMETADVTHVPLGEGHWTHWTVVE